jgi:hypothetical protein
VAGSARLAAAVDGLDGRFRSGDHLRVGVPAATTTTASTSAAIVSFQFGSGITLTGKSGTCLDAVPLERLRERRHGQGCPPWHAQVDHWVGPAS